MHPLDKKAKKILFSTFWKNGWIDQQNRNITPVDFAYARANGLMFDPLTISHDELIAKIVGLIERIPADKVAKAFLSSLSTQRVDWRSSLASWHIAKQLRAHTYKENVVVTGHSYTNGVASPCISHECEECGGEKNYHEEDLNVLNFERVRWGGVRHGSLIYTLLDMDQLGKSTIPEPASEDIAMFKAILQTVDTSAPKDSPGTLRDRLKLVFPSTKEERGTLLEILACVHILQAGDRASSRGASDWTFIAEWRGEDRFNQERVKEIFGAWL
jgi:hypothetical protein